MSDEKEAKATEKEVIAEINAELQKAHDARVARLQGWTPLKDPGELLAGMWDVGKLFEASVSELRSVFPTPWMWGPNVRVMQNEGHDLALQFGVMSPEGRHWSLVAEWRTRGACDEKARVVWYVTGTGCDYNSLGEWLAGVLGRRVSIVGADRDEQDSFGVTTVFSPPKD